MAGVQADVKTDVAKGEVKDVPFDNILNFRDVGKTINDFLGEKYLCLSWPLTAGLTTVSLGVSLRARSSGQQNQMMLPSQTAPDFATRMASKPSLTCVLCISLSSLPPSHLLIPTHRTEHANQVKQREHDLKIPALVQSNEALSGPLKIEGINYLNINVNGKGFERSLLWQLKYWSLMFVPPFFPFPTRPFQEILTLALSIENSSPS
jgi:protein-tyrosine phosphatase